eukprot:gene17310-19731_t
MFGSQDAYDTLGAPVSSPVQFLHLMLIEPCKTLRCYGESFIMENNELRYSESCPDHWLNLPGVFDELAESGKGSSYIDGVGLPGDCKTKRTAEVYHLKTLILDGYFDTGGSRLIQFANVFKLACTLPVMVPKREGGADFIGVVVLYLAGEPTELQPLQAYLEALVSGMGPSYNLLEKKTNMMTSMSRDGSVRSNSISQNDIELDRKVSKVSVVSIVLETGKIYNVEIEENVNPEETTPKQRRPLSIQLLIEKAVPWLKRYLYKWVGGNIALPTPLENKYSVMSFIGSFIAIAVLQVMFDRINDVFTLKGVSDMFYIPTSFGALCAIVYAIPAAPLGQPRIVYLAHTWAMGVSIVIMYIFDQYQYVWLQRALAAGFCVGGMAKFGILNPPSGAISVALITLYNSPTFTWEGLVFDVVSTYMCCTVIILVGMLCHNVLRDRAYPTVW